MKNQENLGNTSDKQSILKKLLKTTKFFKNNKKECKLKVENLEYNKHQTFDKFQNVYTRKYGKILSPKMRIGFHSHFKQFRIHNHEKIIFQTLQKLTSKLFNFKPKMKNKK